MVRVGVIAAAVAVAWSCSGGATGVDATSVDATTCGTSSPLLPSCVEYRLAAIDLNGTWTFHGTTTQSTFSCAGSASPTTTDPTATFPVQLTTTGCMFTMMTTPSAMRGLYGMGRVDDTNGTAYVYNLAGDGSAQFCANADGSLAYAEHDHYDGCARNFGIGDDTATGTLTRQ